jgi:hypothetical protein
MADIALNYFLLLEGTPGIDTSGGLDSAMELIPRWNRFLTGIDSSCMKISK